MTLAITRVDVTDTADLESTAATVLTLSFAYVLLRPVSNNQILIPVLLALAVCSLVILRRTGAALASEMRPLAVVLLVLGTYGTCTGLILDNPGWATGLLAYVVGPTLWWLWASSGNLATVRSTFSAIVWCTITTGVVISAYSLSQQNVIPAVVPEAVMRSQGAGFRASDGLTELRYFGLSTLAATGPICAAIAVVPKHRLLPSARIAAVGALIATFASLQAGRRGQIVLTLLVFVLIPTTQKVLGARTQARTVDATKSRPSTTVLVVYGACLAAATALLFGATPPKAVVAAMSTTFAFLSRSQQSTDEVRLIQARALIDGWLEQPLRGQGFGATIDGLVRSESRPWNFELQYHELLFQTGAVGLISAIILGFLTVRALRGAVQAQPWMAAPILVASIGALSMLIVNATNPYLKAPGHQWAVFLPLMVANVAYSNSRRRQRPIGLQ